MMPRDTSPAGGVEDCPRFDFCNAPVCPLVPSSLAGPHLRGEEVCPYLREAAKAGGEARLACYLPINLQQAVLAALPQAMALGGDISRALARASKSGSQLDAAARARAARFRPVHVASGPTRAPTS
jgi:hypothetical protein